MLNDLEKDTIQVLLTNSILLGVVKKVFNQAIEDNKPLISPVDDDPVLGQKYRAYETSKRILNAGFQAMESYRTRPKQELKENRAR